MAQHPEGPESSGVERTTILAIAIVAPAVAAIVFAGIASLLSDEMAQIALGFLVTVMAAAWAGAARRTSVPRANGR